MAAVADIVPIETSSIVELADFAQTIGADLTVVGPECPWSWASRTSSTAGG